MNHPRGAGSNPDPSHTVPGAAMPSRTMFPAAAFPLLGWFRFTLGYAEMLQSSAAVIAHRVARMAAAGPNPGERDRREFTRIVQEKPQAAAASMQAMALRMMSFNMQQGMWLAQQMALAANGMLGLWMMPFSPPRGRQRLLHRALGSGALQGRRLSQALAHIANGGLSPVRSRATANARRLVYRPAQKRRAR